MPVKSILNRSRVYYPSFYAVGLVAARRGALFMFYSYSMLFVVLCWFLWILSSTVATLLGEEGAGCFAILWFVVCVLCIACHGLFTFPLGVIGRLCSVH